MADAYDLYFATFAGGTVTLAPAATDQAPNITITDTTNTNTTAVAGDSLNDSAGDSGLTFEGMVTITVNGVGIPCFLATDGAFQYLYVPTGTDVSAGGSGPLVTSGTFDLNTPCFVAGTMIATPDGERAVETLAAGDLVLTADGTAKPVRWLGRSTRSRLFMDPVRVLPVRIKAGALGENLPTRDLSVSPGHAVLIDGVLVHASALVNGSSVVRDTETPAVFTYYHVELDSHALLLADGIATESFLSGVENTAFDNLDERPAVADTQEMTYPRVKSARQLPRATREMLAARAAVIAPDMAIAA
jgi:hypothetical protein